MDWSTVVTGVVGVAGIAGTFLGTWLQRRQQVQELELRRSHEIQDVQREERKAAYARFLNLANRVTEEFRRFQSGWEIWQEYPSETSRQRVKDVVDRAWVQYSKLLKAAPDIQLLATYQVRRAALILISGLAKYMSLVAVRATPAMPEQEASKILEQIGDEIKVFREVKAAEEELIEVMRSDLGQS